MTSPRILSLLSAVLLVNITPVQGVRTYYMDDYCGSSIYMYSGAIILELTSASFYQPNMKCVTSVESNRQYMNRIMVRVLDIGLEDSGLCDNDRLMIYDGETTHSSKLTGRYGICGYEAPSKVYKTSYKWVTFNFTSDTSVEGSGFRLLVNGFDDSGICLHYSEYECDNGICVDDDLQCDGYDNCEDDSDEEYCDLSVGGIVGISIGCVAAAIIIAVVVIVFAGNRRRGRTNARVVAATERSYLPGQPYTVYGSPIAGQYPAQNTMPPAYATLYNTPLPAQGPPASATPIEGKQY